jgi:CubicO group peptidase (beta-lactamase class C family)
MKYRPSQLLAVMVTGCAVHDVVLSEPLADLGTVEQRIRQQYTQTVPQAKGAVVVAVFDGTRTLVVGFGERSPADRRPPDENTVFEIGSITKPMSGVLLADEVQRGRLSLDDEANHWLSSEQLPQRNGIPVRIAHLATFSAGLPMMPSNWIPVDQGTYTSAMWQQFLAGYELPYDPGSHFSYGNVGYGVLGDVLVARESTPLGRLFHERIFAPLGMSHSWLLDERPADAPVAQGHDTDGNEVPLHLDKPIQAACCAVESTATDLLRFMRAPIDPATPDELRRAFELAMTPRRHGEGNFADRDVGLGWFVRRDDAVVVATGMMRGYRSGATIDRANRVVTVVLAADAAFPSEALALEARQAVLVERDQPALPVVASLPNGVTPASVTWDDAVMLVGWSAPASMQPGETATVRYYYRLTRPITADYTVFVHGDFPGADVNARVHADHAPVRPTSDWPVGAIIEDDATVTVPADHPGGAMTLWNGFYRSNRMHITASSEDARDKQDRARGPTVTIAP